MLKPGDLVQVLSLPEWITRDLPADEKKEVLSSVGRTLVIETIDKFGYAWIGFGRTVDDGSNSVYCGHSFCVPPDCLRRV